MFIFGCVGRDTRLKKTIEVEPRGSFHAGGIGICHKVEARQVNADDDEDLDTGCMGEQEPKAPTSPHKTIRRVCALYFEVCKWFVSVQAARSA